MRNLLLFLLACLPARLFLANAALWVNGGARVALVLFLATTAVAWLFRTFPNSGFFGGNVFWKPLRPAHAMLYLAAASAILAERRKMANFLLVSDAMVGLVAKMVLDRASP